MPDTELAGLIGRKVDQHLPGLAMTEVQAFMRDTAEAILAAYVLLPRGAVYQGVTERANGACRHTFHVSHNWRDECPS